MLLNAIGDEELNLGSYCFFYTTIEHFVPLYEIAFTEIILLSNFYRLEHKNNKCGNGYLPVRKTTIKY